MDLIPPESYETPWHYGIWNGKISVAFGYADSGWIQMAIMTTAFNENAVVQCSSSFDPFPDMQRWLEQIAKRDLPADWKIDEEGCTALLRVKADKDDQLDFQLWRYVWPEDPEYPPQLKCRNRIQRIQLLDEFHRRFTQYVREDFDPHHWILHPEEDQEVRAQITDLRNIDLSRVRQAIEKETAPLITRINTDGRF